MWSMPVVELFQRGGSLMWALLVCATLAMAVVLERGVVFFWSRTRYKPLLRDLKGLLKEGAIDEARGLLWTSQSLLARVGEVFLDHLHSAPALRKEAVDREASQQLARLTHNLHWLALTGLLAPLLGLLGTALGLVDTFQQVAALAPIQRRPLGRQAFRRRCCPLCWGWRSRCRRWRPITFSRAAWPWSHCACSGPRRT